MRLSIPFASLVLSLVLALVLALSLAACSAPAPSAETPSSAATTPAATTPSTSVAPAPPKATPAAPAPPVVEEHAGGFDAMHPDRTCRTDADCAVKNVGNCCGRFPLCVNKDAKVDPNAVRAQCAKEGMASTCGFQEVGGCQCVQGRCENLTGGAAVM